MSGKMPVAFFGHGSPMNALTTNAYTEGWKRMAAALPRPRSILAISAHWYTEGTAVTCNATQRTIHDFYGFPPVLYRIQYAAPGNPVLAERVRALLSPLDVKPDDTWGLDHGSWSVLLHAYPEADVPVIQLSIDARQPARAHYELARRLAPLREEGVLVAGFGNVVHNLRLMQRNDQAPAYDWAVRFNERVRTALAQRDHDTLIDYGRLGNDAALSVPTPEHYLPLLYVIALQGEDEAVSVAVDGMDLASVSMLSFAIGAPL